MGKWFQTSSIRNLSREFRVSINTVIAALHLLEQEGLLLAAPRIGYYVKSRSTQQENLKYNRRRRKLDLSKLYSFQESVAQQLPEDLVFNFSYALADSSFLPHGIFLKQIRSLMDEDLADFGEGAMEELKPEIIKYFFNGVTNCKPENLTITYGATEAISLALRCICRPGDQVALENPTYFDYFKIIKDLGLQAVAIPTHPQLGMDYQELEKQCRTSAIKVVIVQPTVPESTRFYSN